MCENHVGFTMLPLVEGVDKKALFAADSDSSAHQGPSREDWLG